MSFSEEQKAQILEDCFRDPVLYCKTFLFEHFYLDIPWVHRGLLSILIGKSEFLLKYGDLWKLVSNFVHGEGAQRRQVFHVFHNEKEVLSEGELKSFDEKRKLDAEWSPEAEGWRIDLDLGDFTLLMMPRGISKTTIAGLAVPCYKICYNMEQFLLYVSKAGPHSQGQLESVRKELASNEAIIEFFGDLKPARSDDERWSSEKFETVTGVAMQYRGKGSAIRGVNHNNHRPSTIIVDDPQNKQDVRSDTVREEDKRWAFAELMPARALLTKSTIIVLGTFLGTDCLVDMFARDPRFTTVKMQVRDRDGDWLWPPYMNEERYSKEKAAFAQEGLLADFYREYHNEDIAEDELPFPRRFIIHDPVLPETKPIPAGATPISYITSTFCDPASSEKRDADYTAIITVRLYDTGMLWVLDCHCERGMSEESKMDEYFRQVVEWESVLCGFESVAYQAVFGSQLRAQMFKRGVYFEVIPVPHKTNKIQRVRSALRPRYAAGYVRHRQPFPELENQLYLFRYDNSHKHDDGPDAEAAAVVLLDPAAAYHAEEDPAEVHLEPIEDVIGEEAMNWAS